ncbi:PilC/PilY family type IV pilus protein [uncultured Piscinibacter sp.]|uniref:pilus assembly protein n=1 Tax=uncultured Piscinibacter sp. TaxID=1131835 RepID=UPI002634ECF6|nr:PilC/PilY family type IV pilus protein [uncultured Piscinibacter sp.]
MKTPRNFLPLLPLLAAAALAGVSHAATTDIAQVPLVTSAPNAVLPNLMFILDDSGSMDWDYLPDSANDNICRSSGAAPDNSGSFDASCVNEPPYRSPSFNGSYYNPAITYMPPLYANGTSWPTQNSANTTGWTSVRNDAYGVQSAATTNLISGYADVEYCTDSTYADCLRNGNYVLPGTVAGKNYTTRRATTATGAGFLAIGAPDAATTQARTFGPHYYTMNPGEYCDAPNLRNCQATATVAFRYPAPVRWCNSDANARAAAPPAGSCQALQTPTYSELRIPTKFFTAGVAGTPPVTEVAASAQFRINSLNCNVTVSAVTVNGVNLLSASTVTTNNRDTLGNSIRDLINAGGTGYTASTSNGGDTVRIQAPVSAGNISYAVSFTRTGTCFSTNPATPVFGGYVAPSPGTPATPGGYPGSFSRVEIIPTVTSYPRAASRSDCAAAASCTYAEEMTNFANWFTYYRTRMQSMKTSASFAFGNLSNQYRLGYISINNNTGSDYLNFNQFELTHKENWFSKLTAARPSNATPLRGTLSRVGRLFGGRLNGTTLNGSTVVDPMQYSCQQNFTLLSTDGYWNETGTPVQLNGSTAIGDADGALPRPLLDGTGTSNTLADVAAYYYETDLRTGTAGAGVCAAANGGDLCDNNVPVGGADVARHQHMTTFTLGLGVSGYMLFDENYRSAISGDFFDVANGTAANPANGICTWQSSGACNWPIPVNNSPPNIDDLWHAAVNGRGTYFSAKDPAGLFSGLSAALAAIETRRGAAAAATTSNPNISAADNYVFISRFTAGRNEWTGELAGQQINVDTGQIVNQAGDWSAQSALDANTSRTIYTFDGSSGNKLKTFAWGNLTTGEQSYFETAHITATGRGLSQFCNWAATCLSTADQYDAAGEKLVDFIRGDRSNEGSLSDIAKYYRARAHLLGDIVNSEALYVKKALFNYADTGYSAFKTSTESRRAVVYVGANDGMLHAFDATNGAEIWAYVPSMVMPNLYRLADKNYGNAHQYYVDGSPIGGDIQIGGAWKTILVGGLGAGGRGYYALDVTDPNAPRALWEFTDANLGLSFGKPEITKLKDGTWVVIFASGYNNVSPGDGRGRLYVVRASDGTLLRTIDTGAGDAITPSGLAHIRAWVDRTDVNNTTLRVYGGDNLGNVWRFDVNGDIGASGYDAQLLATLRDSLSNPQPVTARPELGLVSGKAVVYVGTGRYLGVSDLTDTRQQTIYAIKDDLGSTGWGSPRAAGNFVQQFMTSGSCPAGATVCAPSQTVRFGTSNPVDFAINGGWFIDLPEPSERANTDPQLALGTLVFTTNVINPGACTVGGTSYINFFDYRTGGAVTSSTGVVSTLLGNAVATRPTIVRLPSGKVISLTRLSDDRTVVSPIPVGTTPGSTRRISWRELAN